jgi:hypothetical protein
MANNIYIIGANYIKENSELQDNVEEKFIKRSILSAQDIDLQNLLGTELYNLVLSELYNYKITGTTISTRIKTLVDDYVVPTLLYSVLRDVIPFLIFKLTPSSVAQNDNNANTNVTEYKILALFRKEYETKYEHYSNRLTFYLNENNTTFPEWNYLNTSGDNQSVAPKKDQTYFGGIQLDGESRGCFDIKYRSIE